jgi:hypothetical protein
MKPLLRLLLLPPLRPLKLRLLLLPPRRLQRHRRPLPLPQRPQKKRSNQSFPERLRRFFAESTGGRASKSARFRLRILEFLAVTLRCKNVGREWQPTSYWLPKTTVL